MPKSGDSFNVKLKKAHIGWGSHRHTNSRGKINGEAYLKIPASVAYSFNITNQNVNGQSPIYNFCTADGFITNATLKASGNQHSKEFAKQFHGSGDLKLLGSWFQRINAKVGDEIKVDFLSSNEIILSKL